MIDDNKPNQDCQDFADMHKPQNVNERANEKLTRQGVLPFFKVSSCTMSVRMGWPRPVQPVHLTTWFKSCDPGMSGVKVSTKRSRFHGTLAACNLTQARKEPRRWRKTQTTNGGL